VDLVYTLFTQRDEIHLDSSFITTPSGPFVVTRTSRWDHYLRLQTFHSTSGHFLPHERTVFDHTRTPALRAHGPSSFARTTPSRTPTIFILEDPGGYFRVTFAWHVDPSLKKRIFFVADLVHHTCIYHDTRKAS